MSDFILVHVDRSGDLKLSDFIVGVAIGQCGKYEWSDRDVLGHDCATPNEWDQMIDRLIASLEEVRRKGHTKLRK